MTSERQGSETFARAAAEWRRLTPLVERCLDLPENERASFLAGHLNDETHYLEKALDLAAAAAAAESLETPALGIAPPDREASDRRQGTDASEAIPSAPADPLPAPPEEIPGFEILSLLGEGGMGVVYLAEQRRPVERRVALKIAHSRIDAESRRRLASERQAMARLNHPNIARILEAGSTESGRPYFAMEWIRGEPITLACDRMKLSVEERLRLFLGACSGLQHAHQKGVLHRDIKPTNVLVSTDEDPPIAKIIDFGIAKALGDTQLAEGIEKTSGLIGTPAYMSPEALNQNPESDLEEIDTRSDVYSLGVLLFELLVGERPALREPGEGPLAYLLRVSRLDVPSPLARWRSLDLEERAARASLRGVSPQALERRLRDDLVWIVHRATVRDPEQRYASASELAADIERHLADEAVLASPPSTLYRLRKTARRHRLAVASALLVLLTLVGGVVARSLEAERARRSAEEARAANEETTGALNFMISLLTSASPDNAQGRELTALDLLENGSTRLLEGELSETPEARVRLLYATTVARWRLGQLDEASSALKAALALSREEFEEPNIHTAQGLLLAGGVESDRGDSAGGERLLREALELHEQLYGESSPQVAAVLLSLGAVHEETNRWREALGIYRRAREIWLAQPGENARSLATSSHSLAVVHWRLGEYEEATGLLRGAIAALEALGDEASGSLLGSRNTLADVLSEAGRLEEAEALLEATLDSALRVFGPSHSRTGTAYNSLGNLRVRIGSWRAARESYRSAQKAYEAAGGADHPWVAYPVDNLGLLDSAEGRYRDAEGQHRRALEIREAHTAALDLATSWLGLARALNAQGDRPGEVESALGEARALLDAAGQEAQEIEASISLQTGLLRYARGDLEGAAAQIERASAADGFLHARFEARIALAEIARARQRPEQALRHEAEAQEIADDLPLEVSEGWAERFRASLRP